MYHARFYNTTSTICAFGFKGTPIVVGLISWMLLADVLNLGYENVFRIPIAAFYSSLRLPMIFASRRVFLV